MTVHPNALRLEASDGTSPPPGPTIFVRTFFAPPGMPWDQARVALLEAQTGAPLPLADVVYQLRRLDSWVFGRQARYAAFYVRAADAGEAFEGAADVAGRRLRVRFLSDREKSRRAKGFAVIVTVVAFMGVVGGMALTAALAKRADTTAQLDSIDQLAANRLRAARAFNRQRLQAEALDSAGVRGLSVQSVLADLAWASAAKSPDAHIDAYHWDQGNMAVEVRGETAPFAAMGRTIIKSAKPIRPHVWLWGVVPASTGSSNGDARP